MASKAPGVVRVVAFVGGGEEGEVPVFGDVPVEGVKGIYEDGEEPVCWIIIGLSELGVCFGDEGVLFHVLPEAEESRLTKANFAGIISSLERAEYYDWKSARIFQGVGEMLASPTGRRGLMLRVSHSRVFNQALPQPDHAGDPDDHWDYVLPSTVSIRLISRGRSSGKKHARRDEEIAQHFGVRGQHVGEEYIAKLSILDLGYASNTDTLQGGEKPISSRARNALEGYDEENDQQEKVGLREDIPSQNQSWGAMSDEPEKKNRGN